MRVVVIAQRPEDGRFGRLVPDLVAALCLFGCHVSVVDPDAGCFDVATLAADADAYVLTSASEAALSLAGALDVRGAHLVNPYPVAVALRDKIVQSRALSAAGAPVPQGWATLRPVSLRPHLGEGPLIFRDPCGPRGRGSVVVRHAHELAKVPAGLPWLATRYHAPEGPGLRICRIGVELFGVELGPDQRPGASVELSADLRETALRCGEAFGISVYGIDVLRSHGAHWVVDMSAFPGFDGVPRAGRRVARRVIEDVMGWALSSPQAVS